MSKSQTQKRPRKGKPVTFDTVRQLALALPGVEEGTSYGTPAFKVGGKLLARFHQDGESLVLKTEYAAREVLIGANPKTFYITDHYRCWPWMLVRISNVDPGELGALLEEAWRGLASKRDIAARDASGD
ncbi:MAG: MmcQ/YjbR family DNA-binding protein [Acidobacteriota bacterium]